MNQIIFLKLENDSQIKNKLTDFGEKLEYQLRIQGYLLDIAPDPRVQRGPEAIFVWTEHPQNFSENCAVKAFCAAVLASWLV